MGQKMTPIICNMFTELRARLGDSFEFVYVSSDGKVEEFNKIFGELSFGLAVKFDNKDGISKLWSMYKIVGCPTLVTVSSNGVLINGEADVQVKDDQNGDKFPYGIDPAVEIISTPESEAIYSAIGETLLQKQGDKFVEVNTKTTLNGKTLAFYFAASWCQSSQKMTPIICNMFTKLRARLGDSFEFVYVSSDGKVEEFNKIFGELSFGLAVKFGNKDGISKLWSMYKIVGCPTLVTVSSNGVLINGEADVQVKDDQNGDKFPYGIDPAVEIISTPESEAIYSA